MRYGQLWKGLAAVFLIAATSQAGAVVITGYDVTNASNAGTGGWNHTYGGTITPTGTPGYSDYTGGIGTMADGVKVGTTASTTQLFCEITSCGGNSAIKPTITLYLDGLYTLSSLSIFGGDHGPGNTIPGAITGVDVTIGGSTATIASSQFGVPGNSGQLINDLVTLAGTGLDVIATNMVVLSNFTYLENGTTTRGRFSIAEIELAGTDADTVNAPGTLVLFGLAALLASRIRRKAV